MVGIISAASRLLSIILWARYLATVVFLPSAHIIMLGHRMICMFYCLENKKQPNRQTKTVHCNVINNRLMSKQKKTTRLRLCFIIHSANCMCRSDGLRCFCMCLRCSDMLHSERAMEVLGRLLVLLLLLLLLAV